MGFRASLTLQMCKVFPWIGWAELSLAPSLLRTPGTMLASLQPGAPPWSQAQHVASAPPVPSFFTGSLCVVLV